MNVCENLIGNKSDSGDTNITVREGSKKTDGRKEGQMEGQKEVRQEIRKDF